MDAKKFHAFCFWQQGTSVSLLQGLGWTLLGNWARWHANWQTLLQALYRLSGRRRRDWSNRQLPCGTTRCWVHGVHAASDMLPAQHSCACRYMCCLHLRAKSVCMLDPNAIALGHGPVENLNVCGSCMVNFLSAQASALLEGGLTLLDIICAAPCAANWQTQAAAPSPTPAYPILALTAPPAPVAQAPGQALAPAPAVRPHTRIDIKYSTC